MNSRKQLIPILDMFRLVAALLVVFVHYEIIFGHFVVYGALGTTALSWFFILSGFIIAYNYPKLDSGAEYKRFYIHRFIRIYPIYFLAVLFSAGLVSVGYYVMGEQYFTEVRRPFELNYDLPQDKPNQFWWGATLRHLTFTQSISAIETLKTLFNGPLWSLVLEVYFYLVFPALLFLLKPVNTMPRIIAALVLGYCLQFFLIQLYLPEADTYNAINLNVTVYTNPVIRGLEFVFGMLLYKAFALMPAITGKEKTNFLPLILSMVAYLVINYLGENYIPYQYRMYFAAVPVVLVLLLTMTRSHWYPEGKWLKFCAWCGGISYVLYCFHWPLMELIQLFDLLPPALPFIVHLSLLLFVLIGISWLLLIFVESPIRKRLYRFFERFTATG